MVLQKGKNGAAMDERSSNRDCPDLKTVLSQLAKALACARQTDTDPWQFAVEIEHLIADGLTTSDLRWLVSRGYTAHAYEVTPSATRSASFKPVAILVSPDEPASS